MAQLDRAGEVIASVDGLLRKIKDCLERAGDGLEGIRKNSASLRYTIGQISGASDFADAAYWELKRLEPLILEEQEERRKQASKALIV